MTESDFSSKESPKKASLFDTDWNIDQRTDDEVEKFSSVSVPAVISLVFGVISLFYLVNSSLLLLPILAILSSFFAIWSIARSQGGKTGMGLARGGLFLAIVALVAVPIQNRIYCHSVIQQARAFFPLVFDAAKRGEALELYQLRNYQAGRVEVPDEVVFWNAKLEDPFATGDVLKVVNHPVFRILAALGDDAKITFDRCVSLTSNPMEDTDTICLIYAVTYHEMGEKKTFFVPIFGSRIHDAKNGISSWRWTAVAKSSQPKKEPSQKDGPNS